MKAERRHELKDSDLIHALDSGRKYLDTHGKTLGAVAAIVVLIILGTTFARSARRSATADRWKEKSNLPFDTPENTKKSLAALGSLVKESRSASFAFATLVDQGTRALHFASPDGSKPDPELNAIAKGAFESLLQRFPDNRLAKGVAHLGLATVAGNTFVNTRDEALKDVAASHLQAVLSDRSLETLPVYQLALDRKSALDKTFSEVTFAEPLTIETSSADEGTTVIDANQLEVVDPPAWATEVEPIDDGNEETMDDEQPVSDDDVDIPAASDEATDSAPDDDATNDAAPNDEAARPAPGDPPAPDNQ